MEVQTVSSLRILHVLRAPVGGLFRHVRDLARAQAASGHSVGLIVDQGCSDSLTAARLSDLAPSLALGLHATAMGRNPGLVDFSAVSATRRLITRHDADIVHGHGAKGGAYARIAGTLAGAAQADRRPIRIYTPHGGSLHYRDAPVKGAVYRRLERVLGAMTDGVIFESAFAAKTYCEVVRPGRLAMQVVHNGLQAEEFETVAANADAADFVFVGELRALKGVDLLLKAVAQLHAGRDRGASAVRAVIVGDGPDRAAFEQLALKLNIQGFVRFTGAMPARQAFALGRHVVMPSRAESLPYVALEAAAAGKPLIATDVGGVSEIVAKTNTALVAPDDVQALAAAMADALSDAAAAKARAARLRQRIAERFSVATMATDIEAFYRKAACRPVGVTTRALTKDAAAPAWGSRAA